MKRLLFLLMVVSLLPANTKIERKLGDLTDGSRITPIHHINLLDADSSVIYPDEHPLLPFSTQRTCAPCHNYQLISRGWHFNAGDSSVNDGRPGHPFIWSDRQALLQLPLSYRSWPSAVQPAQVGLTALDFVTRFGGQMPGGGIAADTARQTPQNYWRWQVSGQAEVNCFACHDASPFYDAAEYAEQMKRQNFRWATTAASDLARVKGSARDMPDNYDIYWGIAPDEPRKIPPTVQYNAQRFDERAKVDLLLTRKIPDDRCYACHSVAFNVPNSLASVPHEDVHLKAGLHCVDCHSNGLDHQMTRGQETEGNSCAECHLKTGRFGAPRPEHKGFPPVHFKELSCTACHSGPIPADTVYTVRTSIAHQLGTRSARRTPGLLPFIQAPVFAKDASGKMRPHYLIWPVYWATILGDTLQPLKISTVNAIVRPIIANMDSLPSPFWPQVTDSAVQQVLDSLKKALPKSSPALVAGPFVLQQNAQNQLTLSLTKQNPAYLWPLAHDVRPARQALGANGCNDCHAVGAPFFFAKVQNEPIGQVAQQPALATHHFLQEEAAEIYLLSFSFLFRPALKTFMVILLLLLASVFLIYLAKGLNRLVFILNRRQK